MSTSWWQGAWKSAGPTSQLDLEGQATTHRLATLRLPPLDPTAPVPAPRRRVAAQMLSRRVAALTACQRASRQVLWQLLLRGASTRRLRGLRHCSVVSVRISWSSSSWRIPTSERKLHEFSDSSTFFQDLGWRECFASECGPCCKVIEEALESVVLHQRLPFCWGLSPDAAAGRAKCL
mmetsp:Transcript_44767/g.82383  ORF Transcript_44767/g.82383 Transcript_44767/m.82383 type:complete len:178 (-) Transcript_44767:58-591(-)